MKSITVNDRASPSWEEGKPRGKSTNKSAIRGNHGWVGQKREYQHYGGLIPNYFINNTAQQVKRGESIPHNPMPRLTEFVHGFTRRIRSPRKEPRHHMVYARCKHINIGHPNLSVITRNMEGDKDHSTLSLKLRDNASALTLSIPVICTAVMSTERLMHQDHIDLLSSFSCTLWQPPYLFNPLRFEVNVRIYPYLVFNRP